MREARNLHLISLGAGHVKAELFLGGLLRIQFSDDLAFIHDENPVRDIHDFIQFQGDQQNSLAGVPLGYQLFVNVFDGADVQAPGGLDSDQHLRIFVISRAMMAFCWLPPDIARAWVTDP